LCLFYAYFNVLLICLQIYEYEYEYEFLRHPF